MENTHMADIVQMQVPLADVLTETAAGIVEMNNALKSNRVGATEATVDLTFMASLSSGYEYRRENHFASGAAEFSFWVFTASTSGWGSYSSSAFQAYAHFAESIRLRVVIKFEQIPEITAAEKKK